MSDAIKVLVYSDDANTRAEIRLAVGRRHRHLGNGAPGAALLAVDPHVAVVLGRSLAPYDVASTVVDEALKIGKMSAELRKYYA